ncbi:MAG: acyltransferase [Deltaproteobacteria bacterium]|jgi:acetyltransferase-like isoleucine patch superfamily enzyme|nr:acyltransferase [Deltaproteobacteria bacterium]
MKPGYNVQISEDLYIDPTSEIKIEPNGTLIIGKKVRLKEFSKLVVKQNAKLVIGKNVHLGRHVDISCWHRITIGDDVMFANMCNIHDHQHKFDLKSSVRHGECDQFREITIGKGVWIGCRTGIMDGVHIGDYCVIGANSVVTKDIPAGCLVAGSPARIVKCEKVI